MSFIELIFKKQDTFLTLKCIRVVTNTKLYNLKYHLIYELAFQYSFSFRIVIKSFFNSYKLLKKSVKISRDSIISVCVKPYNL